MATDPTRHIQAGQRDTLQALYPGKHRLYGKDDATSGARYHPAPRGGSLVRRRTLDAMLRKGWLTRHDTLTLGLVEYALTTPGVMVAAKFFHTPAKAGA